MKVGAAVVGRVKAGTGQEDMKESEEQRQQQQQEQEVEKDQKARKRRRKKSLGSTPEYNALK